MLNKHIDYYKSYIKTDISAGLVVFLVALPLCLGIALASGAPLFSGLIAGIIGGLVVSLCSGSQLSVSGPAAGLTVIIFNAIEQLGSYSGFLVCVTLAGIIQILLGYLRAGLIGAFFPSAVIKGMLSAIGLILIIKQLPHAVGYDKHFEGDESYMNETAGESFQDIFDAFSHISLGATLITLGALLILIIWDTRLLQRFKLFRRGVAIFAKACFGHPSPSKRQKLNATANAFGAPDVLRTCHFATTIVNSVLAS